MQKQTGKMYLLKTNIIFGQTNLPQKVQHFWQSQRVCLHRETMDIFFSEKHVIENMLKFFLFCKYLLFWAIVKNPQSDFLIFTIPECKDDLTGLFTSQLIADVALSTATVCRPRAPSTGAPTLCPLAPHPPAPQQLSLACHRVVGHHQDNCQLFHFR